jgi:S-DNA-T family DNA segregation ATPase FtsK/SpoIIIE
MRTWIRPAADSCFNTELNNSEFHEDCTRSIENVLGLANASGSIKVMHGTSVDRYSISLDDIMMYKKVLSMKQAFIAGIGKNDIRIYQNGSTIEIEVPTKARTITQYELMLNSHYLNSSSTCVPIGMSVDGDVIFSDIAKMPHMLVCGATGSGKSVFMNSLICSLLFKNTPDDIQFYMIDPKKVELSKYAPLSSMCNVFTDTQESIDLLNRMTDYMDKRYLALEAAGCKNIDEYREKVDIMPRIIVVIDELADLMMVASKQVELTICRLAQLGRAAGIHLIAATQYPKATVISTLIKSNMPTRVSFKVASSVNSRVILDTNGAESLIGCGDGLFINSRTYEPLRFQGAFIEDIEIDCLISELCKNN